MTAANDNQSDAEGAVPRLGGSCPICNKPTQTTYRPFCSRRCADVDLNRWLTGSYSVPVAEDDRSSDSDVEP